MHTYPKTILSIPQQIQSYIEAGMKVPSRQEAGNDWLLQVKRVLLSSV